MRSRATHRTTPVHAKAIFSKLEADGAAFVRADKAKNPEASRQALKDIVDSANSDVNGNITRGEVVTRAGLFLVKQLRGTKNQKTAHTIGKAIFDIMTCKDNAHVDARKIELTINRMADTLKDEKTPRKVKFEIAQTMASIANDPVVGEKTEYRQVDKVVAALLPTYPELANRTLEKLALTGETDGIRMTNTLDICVRDFAAQGNKPFADARVHTLELFARHSAMFSFDDSVLTTAEQLQAQFEESDPDITHRRTSDALSSILEYQLAA